MKVEAYSVIRWSILLYSALELALGRERKHCVFQVHGVSSYTHGWTQNERLIVSPPDGASQLMEIVYSLIALSNTIPATARCFTVSTN
jgi:hypothetical protein